MIELLIRTDKTSSTAQYVKIVTDPDTERFFGADPNDNSVLITVIVQGKAVVYAVDQAVFYTQKVQQQKSLLQLMKNEPNIFRVCVYYTALVNAYREGETNLVAFTEEVMTVIHNVGVKVRKR